ncbi:Protein phosphatase 1F [Oryzias melastigma]|uniref:Protein phosphatase 1F n=1 Tax=Oryzias melastigma TaxID=30732 RepID=A0A834FNC9_ORYME|nr:Protein phosphatase 1F [Oryzias melastigma]
MEEKARLFLQKFVQEFPVVLEKDQPLPASPQSRRVSEEELQGESLELGLRLLSARDAPTGLSALLCRAALTRLLTDDLSPFHWSREAEPEDGEEEVLFQSEGVQRVFINKMIEVALEWNQDPPTLPPSTFQCGVHAIKNGRRKMEDKHVLLSEFNALFGVEDGVRRAYYAVFDGHAGVDAASFAATHLHVNLSKQGALQSSPGSALKAAFKHTDDMFRSKAQRERLRSGSTGVVVLIHEQELTVAWLGDSQALLVREGQEVVLMEPHKPEREDEKQRIEELGGCVTFMGCWRVNGTYAVSRAIGDFDQKPYVSPDADSSTVRLQGNEDYVLLACDGFFDAVQPSEVPQLVMGALQELPLPEGAAEAPPDSGMGQTVAQKLVASAKEAGSSDNITVMLVFLRPLLELASATRGRCAAPQTPAEAAASQEEAET